MASCCYHKILWVVFIGCKIVCRNSPKFLKWIMNISWERGIYLIVDPQMMSGKVSEQMVSHGLSIRLLHKELLFLKTKAIIVDNMWTTRKLWRGFITCVKRIRNFQMDGVNYFVNPDNPDIHTQNIENMWMRVKRKLRRQFAMSRALFQTFLSEFAGGTSTAMMTSAMHLCVHRWLVCCITWYNYIIFCPTDCVTVLFHVFYKYTTLKIALIIYAAIL